MLSISINYILKLTCIVFFIGLVGIVVNRINFSKSKMELILQLVLFVFICFLINLTHNDGLEYYFSNYDNNIINYYLIFFSKKLICCFFGFFLLIIVHFLNEQYKISIKKSVSYLLLFLFLFYSYHMFVGVSSVIFHSLLLTRIFLFVHVCCNFINRIIFWLYQYQIVIKPKTFMIFIPFLFVCVLNDTQPAFCVNAETLPVLSEPNQAENYLKLPYLQLDAFSKERIQANTILAQEEQMLEVEVDLIQQASLNNHNVDFNYECERVAKLEAIKKERLAVINDQISFEYAKEYKLELMSQNREID